MERRSRKRLFTRLIRRARLLIFGPFVKSLFADLRLELMEKHNRMTPAGDYLQDRWSRAEELGFGSESSIYDSALVIGDVKVGRKTWIGPFVVLDGSGGLSIGNNCSISAGVQIYSHDSVSWANSGGIQSIPRASVKIGDRCYLGPNVVVQRGVVIGDGAVIGANSLVNQNVPEGSFFAGNPAKLIRDAKNR